VRGIELPRRSHPEPLVWVSDPAHLVLGKASHLPFELFSPTFLLLVEPLEVPIELVRAGFKPVETSLPP
jgi:hypothetical protein